MRFSRCVGDFRLRYLRVGIGLELIGLIVSLPLLSPGTQFNTIAPLAGFSVASRSH